MAVGPSRRIMEDAMSAMEENCDSESHEGTRLETARERERAPAAIERTRGRD